MMDQATIKNQLTQWLIDFVEKPNSLLGDWPPCPYARAARINNKIEICFAETTELFVTVTEKLPLLETQDVVVICFDHTTISPVDLQQWIEATNQLLMPTNYVILEDHPNSIETVNGVCMNFGVCGLLVVQKLDKLNLAADQLNAKGYYNHWKPQDLDSVVSWRYI
jgi:hypothetical protein